MKQGPRYHVKPRRQREGKTDYRNRLQLLKSRKIRIVVRKSLKNTRVQFVDYTSMGDKVLASAISSELVSKYNWKFSPATTAAAYLTGMLAGKRARNHGIEEGVLDIGRHRPANGSKIFAALKGVLDTGILCPHDKEKLPDENRIQGKHLNRDMLPMVTDIKNKILGDK
jgi:large subunit ribosomal protein L18